MEDRGTGIRQHFTPGKHRKSIRYGTNAAGQWVWKSL
jgi:hypothetical protein